MKPPRFDYLAPTSLDEALGILTSHGDEAKVLAGGQSLVPLLNFRLVRPAHLVDLNEIPGLDRIGLRGDRLVIGAMARQRAVETSALVSERCPLLAEAMPQIGHVQIRNRGTIGGSLVHADPGRRAAGRGGRARRRAGRARAPAASACSRRTSSSSATSPPRSSRRSCSSR